MSCAICSAEGAQPAGAAQANNEVAAEGTDVGPHSTESDVADRVSNYEELIEYAQLVAARPGKPREELPAVLADLDYDAFRMIAFRYEKALWWNQERPFWLEFFHRGFVHRDRVTVHLISDASKRPARASGRNERRVTAVPFSKDLFEYRGPTADMQIPPETGFAGLKVVGNFPKDDSGQEMLTFLGASYFRCRSAKTVYGTSARGLAVNPAGAEEFPVFREFWIKDPRTKDKTLTLLALLDGVSVAGAYEFTLHPGTSDSVVSVRSTLFFRDPSVKVGIAPLTSMWMWGDGLVGPPKDQRPAVHDADGLQIQDGEQWTWRALSRQDYPSLTSIPVTSLKGFGLIQRDRRWESYRDDEAKYHSRPSVWIEPKGSWQGGHVELFEMPAIHEGHDNIACYWVPTEKPQPLEPVSLDYNVRFFDGTHPDPQPEIATVQQTAVTRCSKDTLDFDVKFSRTASLAADSGANIASLPNVEVTSIRGEVLEKVVTETDDGMWNVRLKVRPVTESDPIELKAVLRRDETSISETWSYLAALEPPPYKFPQVYTRQD